MLGVAGLLALARRQQRHLLWLLVFPAAYFVLIAAMGIAVTRNLYPLLPPLAAFAGTGLAAGTRWLRRRGHRWPATALLVLALLPPVLATGLQTAGLSRPGTRVQAREWLREHLPPGASILREEYTPELNPAELDAWRPKGVRFAGEIPLTELAQPEVNFVLLSTGAYARFFTPQREGDPQAAAELAATRERYQEIFEGWPQVADFPPGPARLGPGVSLYQVPLPPPPYPTEVRLRAAQAFLPDGGMRTQGGAARYTREGQWALFRVLLAAGSYTASLNAPRPPGSPPPRIRALDLTAHEVARVELPAGQAVLQLPFDGVYFLYVDLPVDSELRGIALAADLGP